MSEPKSRAKSLKTVVPGVYTWSVLDERIGGSASDAHAVVERKSVVLIDPLPLSRAAEAALGKLGEVEAILLTGSWHQRSAWRYRDKFGAKVFAPRGAEGLEGKPDRWYKKGDKLPGGLVAVHTPGPTEALYGFFRPAGGGVFFSSDVLIRVGRGKVSFLPEAYQENPKKSRATVKKLLGLKFKTICFGHGRPLKSLTRRTIAAAIKADNK